MQDLYEAWDQATRKVPYTIEQVDDAIRAICGPDAVRSGDLGWNRPAMMTAAAARAWIEQYPEDTHTVALRSALLDLQTDGCMKPVGGFGDR